MISMHSHGFGGGLGSAGRSIIIENTLIRQAGLGGGLGSVGGSESLQIHKFLCIFMVLVVGGGAGTPIIIASTKTAFIFMLWASG